ncbi:DUF2398 family protein [Actinoplanes sichuanensis]|uniref:DUF2398 family protein n=1 Tax=Actinoplanes sichuanensis TaxID=512349 RepID=A0ABW4A2Q9_9ACTN
MSDAVFDPEAAEAARHLTIVRRISSSDDPVRYRAVLAARHQLAGVFRDELGWSLVIQDMAGLVRLHKRRDDPPSNRGPYLPRTNGPGAPAGKLVLVLVTLICEQLWRRPRISLRELVQAVAQVCAAESTTGRLPAFRIVATDGVTKREAQNARQDLSDALKLLIADGEITVDADIDRALADEQADCVVTANRDSLATKIASLSPSLLNLSDRPPHEHSTALTATSLPDADTHAALERAASVEGRRLTALRRIADDPGTDPGDDPAPLGYLATLSGRERALTLAANLGLAVTVRRDWWEITDPAGGRAGLVFPQGRRTTRQAALALLAELTQRPQPDAAIPLAEIEQMLQNIRTDLPGWASSYAANLALLARDAAAELIDAGLLTPASEPDQWLPTPGIHLWRVQVRHDEPARPAGPSPAQTGDAQHWRADTFDLFIPATQEPQ